MFTKGKKLRCEKKKGWKLSPVFRSRSKLSCLGVAIRFTKENREKARALSKGAQSDGMHEDQLVREHGEAERFAQSSPLVFQLLGSSFKKGNGVRPVVLLQNPVQVSQYLL